MPAPTSATGAPLGENSPNRAVRVASQHSTTSLSNATRASLDDADATQFHASVPPCTVRSPKRLAGAQHNRRSSWREMPDTG